MLEKQIQRMHSAANKVELNHGMGFDLNKINYLAQLHDKQLSRVSECFDKNTTEMAERVEHRLKIAKQLNMVKKVVRNYNELHQQISLPDSQKNHFDKQ